MNTTRIRQIVRQFHENGMKLLLENPANVREVLSLVDSESVAELDLDRLALVKTTFVERDYRHVESDVVLTAPLRGRRGRSRRASRRLIYFLIEHQSEPDALMALRLLDYLVQIYKYQMRMWQQDHGSLRRIRLSPVIPVVFYTGTRRWNSIGQVSDTWGSRTEAFHRFAPQCDPLFINLPSLDDAALTDGGVFGQVLNLVKSRKSRRGTFRQALEQVVRELETLAESERLRWLELLSYTLALVYHERDWQEHEPFRQIIEDSVQTDPHRQELFVVKETIAEVLEKKGRDEGLKEGMKEGQRQGEVKARQELLIRGVRIRFGAIPSKEMRVINSTTDLQQLDQWLDRLLTVQSLADLDIQANRG